MLRRVVTKINLKFPWKFFMLLLATVISLRAQSREDSLRLQKFKQLVNMPVVYKVVKAEDVRVTSDVAYLDRKAYAKMDIYEPSSSKVHLCPMIFLVHGKTPIETNPKDWGLYVSWGNLLASEGFIAVVLTHGLAIPSAHLEDAGEDLVAALKFMKVNSSKYQADTTRISAIAFSAGVPLLSTILENKQDGIKSLVAFYGFMDANEAAMFASENKRTLDRFSLIKYADGKRPFPPIFIARAGLESNAGLNGTIDTFTQKALDLNMSFTIVNHPNGVHGFDNQNNDARTKEIIEQLIVFLKYHFI